MNDNAALRVAIHIETLSAFLYVLQRRALLSNGPGGPGPRAPELQRAPERLSCNYLLRHHKQNGTNSNGRIEYRINSEFSKQYIPNG